MNHLQDTAGDRAAAIERAGYQPVSVVLRPARPPEHPEPYWSPLAGTTGREPPFGAAGTEPYAGQPWRLALRPPPVVLILDVDHYGTKAGADTIRRAGAEWGPLPPAYNLTARGPDDPGGKRLYRLPAGRDTGMMRDGALSRFGGDVELVRTGHRFSWAPGDINGKTGTPVKVYDPAGNECPLPPVTALPELPGAWCDGLESGDGRELSGAGVTVPEGPDGRECPTARAWFGRQDWAGASPTGARAHQAAVHLKRKAAEGHYAGPVIDDVIDACGAADAWDAMWDRASLTAQHNGGAVGSCCRATEWMEDMFTANGQAAPGASATGAPPADLLAGIKTGAWLNGQAFAPLRYHVDGLVPEGLTLLTGAPKVGKSWLVLGWLLDLASQGGAVLYLALEDSDRRMQWRCRTLLGGKPIPETFAYLTETEPDAIVPTVAQFTEQNRDRAPLIVLDTLGKALQQTQRRRDEPSYERDYRITSELQAAVKGCPGAGLVICHHDRKATGEDWLDKVSGTRGITGGPDTVLLLLRPRQEDAGTLLITGRDVEDNAYAMTHRDGRWTLDGDSLPAAAGAYAARKATERLGDRSADILAYVNASGDKGARTADVAARFGITPDEASVYLGRLYGSGRVARPVRGLYKSVGSVGNTPADLPNQQNQHNPIAYPPPTGQPGPPMSPANAALLAQLLAQRDGGGRG